VTAGKRPLDGDLVCAAGGKRIRLSEQNIFRRVVVRVFVIVPPKFQSQGIGTEGIRESFNARVSLTRSSRVGSRHSSGLKGVGESASAITTRRLPHASGSGKRPWEPETCATRASRRARPRSAARPRQPDHPLVDADGPRPSRGVLPNCCRSSRPLDRSVCLVIPQARRWVFSRTRPLQVLLQ